MIISGVQKLTLLDFPGRTACTVFFAGCNFRCPFCHNAILVERPQEAGSVLEEDFFDFLKKRKGLLDGVAITGGEPTLNKDLPEFMAKIKELGYAVKLDSNGTNPEMLEKIISDGCVDYIAMDIKNCKEKYSQTAGVDNRFMERIERSVDLLMQNKVDFEFRTTVVKQFHTVEDMIKLSEWIKGDEKYFIQAFKNSGDLIDENMESIDYDDYARFLEAIKPQLPNSSIRGL
ncbi:MAG: anaerobic ribonucleoside-triphosphate reductase activating protein [Clostridiales bacterium]|nr:anaerobic ribonucleoside-triphosphate reductase activating protein [Clostridiales bacterium]